MSDIQKDTPDDHEDTIGETTDVQLEPSISEDVMAEIAALNRKAEEDRQTGQTLQLGLPPEPSPDTAIPSAFPSDVQNPDESYTLYYQIQRFLELGLPHGKEHERLRDFVYEEKNVYLRRGKKKSESKNGVIGADSRMAYIEDLRTVLAAVKQWAADSGDAINLFNRFYDLNIRTGYRKAAA